MKCLIVPSNREANLKNFLDKWKEELTDDFTIIVIEDGPHKTFDINVTHHYSWKEIEDDLGLDAWVISKQDSAIRCYGFLIAHKLDAEYIFTLDDDCEPSNRFFDTHINVLENTEKWGEIIPGVRTRGIPYRNKGKLDNVVANVGLWTNIPDYDSLQTLSLGIPDNFCPPENNFILPRNRYYPICGMNLAFKGMAAPLLYFPLMGKDSPYGRFDDIWFGIVFKKICDQLNWSISAGLPFVKHCRASDPFANLVKEAPGISFNEKFWEIIDGIPLHGDTPKKCMLEIGRNLENTQNEYLKRMGGAIQTWIAFFD